ncbi:hypothetical protein DOTSEDRAFT_74917 [Dothistroma septosporum NZE10]|uniref:Methyltransferase type 11 domain-containing protein n=1 Tax=Dothistroma septosporum (strain NZE10 / CBS 128990) TaxID=675120 RepID=N1PDU6_DOTSN|nr:hypothetical protein DOTSEDRAFT_74917 [Dothistroma septosporum NZE10]
MPQEKIFTSFTPEQAATYAKNRGLDYPQQLYDTILDFHLGGRNVVLDVGTGPGTVVFNLLPFFAKCLGCDSSESMIKQAKQTAERLQVGDRVAYALCSGEECDQAFPNDKADVMTLALAAHWLDLAPLYAAAAKALRPGGTLAMGTCSHMCVQSLHAKPCGDPSHLRRSRKSNLAAVHDTRHSAHEELVPRPEVAVGLS